MSDQNINNKSEKAVEYFSQKMHCSQAVLATYSEECGISEEQAFKLGSCFGSGMRKGEVCGLFTDFCPKMVASAVDILEEIRRELKE